MQTIFIHRVEITDGTGIIKDNEYSVVGAPVAAESDKELVVLDPRYGNFVVIKKVRGRHDNFSTCLGVEAIGTAIRDSVWGNRISYLLYSPSRKRAKTIRNEIQAEMEKKFGFFAGKLDLSIVKDEGEEK